MTVRGRAVSYGSIGLLVLATVAAAVVSSASGASANTAVVRAWHGVQAGPRTPVSDPHQEAAIVEARGLLGRQRSGPGWTPASSPATHVMAAPFSAPATPNLVDLYELWTVQSTVAAVRSWTVTHPPAGSREAGSGTTVGGTGLLDDSVTYSYPTVAGRFESRQLLIDVTPLAGGAVGVRVDAQVIWYPSRPGTERVPGGMTTVTATVSGGGDEFAGSAPTIMARRTFTGPRVVALLAQEVDALPLEIPATRSCPMDNGMSPQLELVFSGRPGLAGATVDDDSNGCGGVTLTVGRVTGLPLTDNGLFHRVDQLLGLDLPTIATDR